MLTQTTELGTRNAENGSKLEVRAGELEVLVAQVRTELGEGAGKVLDRHERLLYWLKTQDEERTAFHTEQLDVSVRN